MERNLYNAAMHSNDIIRDERVMRVRALKDENARLKAELARLSAAHAALESHVAIAVLAARDATMLPPGGEIMIFDGWNILLGARSSKRFHDREELLAAAAAYVRSRPAAFAWIVYDGTKESASVPTPHVRVSYTGGEGEQRADRLILDFLRMMSLSGQDVHPVLVTGDLELARAAAKLNAKAIPPDEFPDLR